MTEATIPKLPCLCATLRRATRTLTQMYEEALRPAGLRATQFTILQALSLAGEVTQGELGRILAIDSTTLTRTLEIMRGHDWITQREGEDRRERWLRLSKAGKTQLQRALPHWENVQERLRCQLGNECWNDLFKLANDLTNSIAEKGGLS